VGQTQESAARGEQDKEELSAQLLALSHDFRELEDAKSAMGEVPFRDSGFGFRVSGFELPVSGFGFRV
jgi:hypothetical protein